MPGTVELTLRIAVPEVEMVSGEIDALRLNDDGYAVRVTVSVNPLRGEIVMVDVPGLTVSMLSVVEDELMEKSGAITVTETNTGWTRRPLVPIT